MQLLDWFAAKKTLVPIGTASEVFIAFIAFIVFIAFTGFTAFTAFRFKKPARKL